MSRYLQGVQKGCTMGAIGLNKGVSMAVKKWSYDEITNKAESRIKALIYEFFKNWL